MKKAEPDLAHGASPGGGTSGGPGQRPAAASADGPPAGGGDGTPTGPGDGTSTRRRILSIALTLMSQRGVDGTSMRDLASAAGLNVASLYHYFPSKRDLLEAVLIEQGFLPLNVTAVPRLGGAAPGRPADAEAEAEVGPVPTELAGAVEALPADATDANDATEPAGAGADAIAADESELVGLLEGILKSMFEVEDFVRLMVGEAMRGEATARLVGLELFSNFERSIEAWVRTHRPDLGERAGAAEVARLIAAMVIGLFVQHAAGALPDEGDDLAAMIARRSVEAARVISP